MRLPLILLLGFACQDRQAPDDIDFQRDVAYGKGGDVELKLNLARPKTGDTRFPCVVVIHGGGWSQGNRAAHDEIVWKLAKRGYVGATVGYRLAPDHRFPAQVEDVKCAVRFLRANAEKFNLDPARIGAVGFSAGGHLSMMLGVTGKDDGLEGTGAHADQSSQVNAVVSFFGPTDLAAKDWPDITRTILKGFIGATVDEKPEEYRRASPITYVSKGDAPMLLLQGTKDPLVPHTQATAMIEAMSKAGVPGRLELIAGAGHGWGGDDLARTESETYDFLDRQLKAKK